MRQNKILSVTAFAMLALAVGIHYGMPPVAVAQPRQVAVETLPETIGGWHAGAEIPIPDVVKKTLVTAHIVDRMYSNSSGQSVELLLLTASRRDDIHDPARCLPSQGWHVENNRTLMIGSQKVNAMTLEQDDNNVDAYYWLTGYYAPQRPANAFLAHLYSLRNRIVSRQEGMSLFVRLMATDNAENGGALDQFALDLQPYLLKIKNSAVKPGEHLDIPGGVTVARG